MPTCTLAKPIVALIRELCAGALKAIAVTAEDDAAIRALQQVKEDVEQMIQTRAETENIPFPRWKFEEDRQTDPILRGTRRQAQRIFEDRARRVQREMDAREKARQRALEKAREEAQRLEKIFGKIQDIITQAEAAMQTEKDPKGGHAALDRIEDIIDSEAETIHQDQIETDDEAWGG